jgi:hypothetical protein
MFYSLFIIIFHIFLLKLIVLYDKTNYQKENILYYIFKKHLKKSNIKILINYVQF